MRKILMHARPSIARREPDSAIHQTILRLEKHLPEFGYELVEATPYDLQVAHVSAQANVDVLHNHGLYPTGIQGAPHWWWGLNRAVIESARRARVITCVSEWVADLFRRDMGVNPYITPLGVDTDEWKPAEPRGYVLWNKARHDAVCDSTPLAELARLEKSVRFATTFTPPDKDVTPNVKALGLLALNEMKQYTRHASVYLATTRETFGLATLEAMACGVPILGYNYGNTPTFVQHGVNGYLVEPDDMEGLREGLAYCLKYRDTLGANARETAKLWTWEKSAAAYAAVYDDLLTTPQTGIKVSVVVPLYNYERWVCEAIESVLSQDYAARCEIILVDDGSTDNGLSIVRERYANNSQVIVFSKPNGGVASARNYGIERAKGDYILCLDADDRLGSPLFLQTLADALDKDPSLGIAYTGLTIMTEAGELSPNVNPFPSVWDFDAQVEGKNQVPTACLFRKEAWKRAGGYRSYLEPAEDARLWLTIGAIGYRAEQITTEGWFHYRVHANSLSRSKKEPVWNNFAWRHDNRRPFAAHGRTPSGTWAVRNYDKPLISIIVPVSPYHTAILQRALDSIDAQSERRWECIVVNDSGETLNLPAWVREIKSDKRQAAGSRNLGLQAATAPLVTFLDADDYWQLTFLERTLRAHQKTGRYAYTDIIMHQKDGTIGVHVCDDYDPNALFQKPIPHGINMLLKREDALAVGGFDETMSTWEDVDFMMKLAIKGVCGVRVPEPLLVYDYRTGQLREKGMTDNRDKTLRNQLHTRYLDYMEGRKMCSCDELPSGSNGTASSMMSTFLQEGEETVRVELLQPAAPIEYIGKATRHNYQFHQRGDVFLVFRADYEADSENLAPLVVREVKSVAIVPPPPILIGV